jgi:hypothetical protein
MVVVCVSHQDGPNRVERIPQESHAAIDLGVVGRNAPESQSFEGGIGKEWGGEEGAIPAPKEKSPRAQIADLEMDAVLGIVGR